MTAPLIFGIGYRDDSAIVQTAEMIIPTFAAYCKENEGVAVLEKLAHQLFDFGDITFMSVWTDAGNDAYAEDSVSNSECLRDDVPTG